jgi:hypothetical protein
VNLWMLNSTSTIWSLFLFLNIVILYLVNTHHLHDVGTFRTFEFSRAVAAFAWFMLD